MHTWDIEVALDPEATIPRPIVELVVDNLELIGRYTAQPTAGDPTTITVRTRDPERHFTLQLRGRRCVSSLPRSTPPAPVTSRLPTEAFARLVYGRARLSPTRRPSWETPPSSTGSGPPSPDPDRVEMRCMVLQVDGGAPSDRPRRRPARHER